MRKIDLSAECIAIRFLNIFWSNYHRGLSWDYSVGLFVVIDDLGVYWQMLVVVRRSDNMRWFFMWGWWVLDRIVRHSPSNYYYRINCYKAEK